MDSKNLLATIEQAEAAEKAAAEMATKLHTWLRDSCKIDDSKERDQIISAFVHPRYQPSALIFEPLDPQPSTLKPKP